MCERTCGTQFKLVALDIDGTVLNSDGQVTAELRQSLAELVDRSVHVVLCTGRRWRNSVQVAEELGCAHPVVVCCGGSLIKRADDERTLYVNPLTHGLARLAVRLFREGGLVPLLLYDRPLNGRELKIGECDRARAEGLPYVRANPGCFEWYGGECPEGEEAPLVVYSMDNMGLVREAEKHICNGVAQDGIVEAMFQRRYGPDQLAVEVHSPTATKWDALDWLLRRWGIRAEEVVAVGDDVNDVVMLRSAGLSFAMGNATAEVKAAADAVTGSNDEHGVARALQQVFHL